MYNYIFFRILKLCFLAIHHIQCPSPSCAVLELIIETNIGYEVIVLSLSFIAGDSSQLLG